jgi:hypoxanthine phosphoribosyltransferase
MHDDIEQILISADEIAHRIVELGEQITSDYRDRELLLVGILKGAVPFLVDLARQIKLPLTIDFLAISSYGAGTTSSGVVRLLKDLDGSVSGKHLVIVEDIVDSGLTLQYIRRHLEMRESASVRVCGLLWKERDRVVEVPCDYVGFRIPDRFVVGYGLDYAERYRNLPYIGVLRPEIYTSLRH